MKFKKMIALQSESYEEEQFILNKFPDSVWINLDGGTTFYVPESKINEALHVLKEWRNRGK